MQILSFGSQIGPQSDAAPSLFLHGFPGIRSKQNREIAERVSAHTGRPARVFLYAGLGHAEGTFDFRRCRETVMEHFEREAAPSFDLIGHSWGGFLALSIASQHPERVRKLVLMSPLLRFHAIGDAEPAFAAYASEHPEIALGPIANLVRSYQDVGKLDVAAMAARIDPRTEVLLMQAKDDPITPPEFAEDLLANFKRRPTYEVVNNDHSFLADREQLSRRIADFLG